jgi:exopolyphosphatase/guanosine-5'-triphosphate,3'-diphosphate pyrophosphatase
MAQLYHIDRQHAEKVRLTAMTLFDGVADSWVLADQRHTLEYAAILHEIGIHISSRAHHKHGAYIIANSDMPGFGEQQQQLLARLIGNQRKKLDLERLTQLDEPEKRLSIRLIALIRLAVLLNLGRIASGIHISSVSASEQGLNLALKEPKHRISLFVKDLQREQKQMANVALDLQFSFA